MIPNTYPNMYTGRKYLKKFVGIKIIVIVVYIRIDMQRTIRTLFLRNTAEPVRISVKHKGIRML